MAIPNKFDKLGNLIPFEEPLTLTAKSTNCKVKLIAVGNPIISGLKYRRSSKDNWQKYTINTEITLTNIDDYVQFKNDNNRLSMNTNKYVQFIMSGNNIEVSGNIQSMLNYSDICDEFSFLFLFSNCSSLTSAPELPAIHLKYYCYGFMFYNCTSLIKAPNLPATSLEGNACYGDMFNGCTSLINAPELPATILTNGCYWAMFKNCTSLIKAPNLPATTLVKNCYYEMFKGCTSLKEEPLLPATTLAQNCYREMFQGCSSLNKIKVGFKNWEDASLSATTDWLSGVANIGDFEKPYSLTDIRGDSNIPTNWKTMNDTLTLIAAESNSTIKLTCLCGYDGVVPSQDYEIKSVTSGLQYRTSESNSWSNYTLNDVITLSNINDYVQFRNTANKLSDYYTTDHIKFVMTGKINGTGNVQSLLNYSDTAYLFSFYNLFRNCNSLISAPDLGAENLEGSCYDKMFKGCTNLTALPKNIKAKTFTAGTHHFKECFSGCTSLTSIPDDFSLAPSSLAGACYTNMFELCSGIVSIPQNFLPAISLADNCYYEMFKSCNSLTTIPELPATNLRNKCYQGMFSNCSSLIIAPILSATTLNTNCYTGFLSGCTSLEACPPNMLPATTLTESCYEGMFQGCIKLKNSPILPPTTLQTKCYKDMFKGCSSLDDISINFTNWNDSLSATLNWVENVNSNGFFTKPLELTDERGNSRIPTNWNVLPSEDLTLVAAEANSTVKLSVLMFDMSVPSSNYQIKSITSGIQYRTKGNTNWTNYTLDTIITLTNINDYVQFRNTANELTKSQDYDHVNFIMTGKIKATGNIMSMLNYSSSTKAFCFNQLFRRCSSLLTPPELPSINLGGERCYAYMFCDCTSLTYAPTLPATTLPFGAYANMFQHCTSLTAMPRILATSYSGPAVMREMFAYCTNLITIYPLTVASLTARCYYGMFIGCTSLLSIPNGFLPSISLADDCYFQMFESCTNLITIPINLLPGDTLYPRCYQYLFRYCNSLIITPTLSATSIAEDCYRGMFAGTAISEAPTLPAMTLYQRCYQYMFENCVNLTTIPTNMLPAINLAVNCYLNMFIGCTSITNPPNLPATNLANYCYLCMFQGCTSLITAPELPATTLAQSCYFRMFYNCTSLMQAPDLPATTLINWCYGEMFYNCTSLTKAPDLPAVTLVERCYSHMFENCTSLSSIQVSFTQWNDNILATPNLLYNVSPSGKFIKPYSLPTERGKDRIPTNWDVMIDTLTFVADETNSTIKIVVTPANPDTYDGIQASTTSGLQYRTDETANWTNYTLSSVITLTNINDYVQFKNTANTLSDTNNKDYVQFVMTGKIKAEGNIQSLLNYSDSCHTRCYQFLFKGCASLIKAPELPALNLANCCYRYIFAECTSLTQAPELQATTLAPYCYNSMFSNCTSLIETPELPATTLVDSCYAKMFQFCSSLTYTPNLPATTLAENCYESMFSNCTSLINISELPALTLVNGNEYKAMFQKCRSLTTAPTLPATVLSSYCYSAMFQECTNLVNVQEILPATTLAPYCYNGMFYGCTSLTKAPELPATTLAQYCYQGMFKKCTSLTKAPELPATTLATSCYLSMFENCSSLVNVPDLPAATLEYYCYQSMFNDTAIVNAPKISAKILAPQCYYQMFAGCANLINAPELPATTLTNKCYERMFAACRKLQKAPDLPASSLTDNCYAGMFGGCWNLNYINANFTNWNSSIQATDDWVNNISTSGFFFKSSSLTDERGTSRIPTNWTVINSEDLTLFADEANSTVKLTCLSGSQGEPIPNDYQIQSTISGLQYRTDVASGWTNYTLNTVINLTNVDDYVQFRNTANTLSNQWTTDHIRFVMTGKIKAKGSIMGMLNYSNTATDSCFYALFKDCTSLIEAPTINAEYLEYDCYDKMFKGCTNLIELPKITAKQFISRTHQFKEMFYGCTSITSIPENYLPISGLTIGCYARMFQRMYKSNYYS